MTGATVEEVAALWGAVVRAGGAVGLPVNAADDEIRAAAGVLHEATTRGSQDLLVERGACGLRGMVVLRPARGALFAHRADVAKLMVAPSEQGIGVGSRLLGRVVDRARERGFRQLRLSTRGGGPLPAFYRRRDWTEVGVFPGALQTAPGTFRDEHWFQRDLP
ncbi:MULTISPECIES: GNAT family N-acetyltransferase [unclassified Pseudonocardia]|uniref:GNAT family N-acetyltransferase n=1 Tax=unclassified Pseudonocardia TaxID=2619320 RepID=UPI0001FFED5E|nr:GNAT family N-acetyltransferase [Pseudonocardia sp. Ae707_Ps1]OLM17421.1 acetyltransferase [Pseudonocardia sp. Ae707_Ps1]